MSKRSHVVGGEACEVEIVDDLAVQRALSEMPAPSVRKAVVDIHDALADETRLRILLALSGSELCVCDLASICGITSSGVSHQLRLLRDRDLVAHRRDGKRAVYSLSDDHVRVMLSIAIEHAKERAR
ncbi:MAG: metalloregulator ArsR/SmtB family transcription factor [Coriobacteriia bacterium]|nr:metalloregulator ArsR/SmtB family transcription factor [Coriobacteriia bacterium]